MDFRNVYLLYIDVSFPQKIIWQWNISVLAPDVGLSRERHDMAQEWKCMHKPPSAKTVHLNCSNELPVEETYWGFINACWMIFADTDDIGVRLKDDEQEAFCGDMGTSGGESCLLEPFVCMGNFGLCSGRGRAKHIEDLANQSAAATSATWAACCAEAVWSWPHKMLAGGVLQAGRFWTSSLQKICSRFYINTFKRFKHT